MAPATKIAFVRDQIALEVLAQIRLTHRLNSVQCLARLRGSGTQEKGEKLAKIQVENWPLTREII
jgi:hypothetical protein